MKKYIRPAVTVTEETGEGVYAAFGCLGCNCYRQGYCGLEELQWGSYDNDNGFRKPGWEQEGKSPTDRAW